MGIKEAKELITGKYFIKHRNGIEMQKLHAMVRFFQQNGWEINVMAYMYASGAIHPIYPGSFLLWAGYQLFFLLTLYSVPNILLTWFFFMLCTDLVFIYLVYNMIPHPTTIGYWVSPLYLESEATVHTYGLLGQKNVTDVPKDIWGIRMWTIGFTGFVIPYTAAFGFVPFIAMKEIPKNAKAKS